MAGLRFRDAVVFLGFVNCGDDVASGVSVLSGASVTSGGLLGGVGAGGSTTIATGVVSVVVAVSNVILGCLACLSLNLALVLNLRFLPIGISCVT